MRVAGILDESITDGPGIRMTVFFQGCPHHCKGCHNHETWDYEGGEDITIEEVLQRFDENPLLSGMTVSGGDPLSECHLPDVLSLAKEINKRGKTVWVYTGYTLKYLMQHRYDEIYPILQYVDVLVDGPFIEEKKDLTLLFRGSSNQRLIDIQEFLRTGNIENALK